MSVRKIVAVVSLVLLISLITVTQVLSRSTPLDRLRENIERSITSVDATWGIYIRSLETGEEIAINADETRETMSTIKLPLMVEVFAQAKEGRLDLNDRYSLAAGDIVQGGGVLENLDPGANFSVRDLVTLMITVSDNTATDILYRMVGGPEVIAPRMKSLGLEQTRAVVTFGSWFDSRRFSRSSADFYRSREHPLGLTTPREMGKLLEMMEEGELVDARASAEMLAILRKQFYRTRIPRLVTGYVIPHKSGTFPPYVVADVGVLEAPGQRIVITMFAEDHFGSLDTVDETMARVAKEIADYFAYRAE
jgi:beta-lactamase class A